MDKRYEWLDHLYNALTEDTYGYTVTPYSIALEGWRRGLELTFHYTKQTKSKARYSLSDGEKTHKFVASRGDLVTTEAMKICKDKFETKKYLRKANVPTPKGDEFGSSASDEEIIEFANKTGYPLVIKPVDGTGGNGVIANIKNEVEFKQALEYVRYELDYKHVIVEDHFTGEDYRVYVVGDKAVAVAKRISPNVIGDGVSSIKELIQMKNKEKSDTKLYKSSLIKIDKELKSHLKNNNLTLDSVPKKDERVFVKSINNVTAGGDPVDATDELFPEAKQIAVDALNAIPELGHGGVDVMVNHETKEATIIEVNSQANIRLNLFPMEGKARDIPKAIIDFYFPNTKQNLTSNLIFDFGDVWKRLKSKKEKNITVPNHVDGNLELTRYMVKGSVRNINFAQWIKEIANQHHLHGYAKHVESGALSIVVCGEKSNIAQFEKVIQNEKNKEHSHLQIERHSRKSPVFVGFTIINAHLDKKMEDGYFPVRLKDPGKKVSSKKRKTVKVNTAKVEGTVEPKNDEYKKKYEAILNSTSWRITKPLRVLNTKMKRKN